jgi:hypothetical protein
MRTKLPQMIRWLRRHFPTKTPTIVKVVAEIPGAHGICLVGEGRALIRLARSTEPLMKETLIEEWCHVLRHDTPVPCEDDHDQIFWAIYGHVTKAWRGE